MYHLWSPSVRSHRCPQRCARARAHVRVHLCDNHDALSHPVRQRDPRRLDRLLPDTQPFNDRPITRVIDAAKIVQQPPPTSDELQEPPAGMMVFLMGLEM